MKTSPLLCLLHWGFFLLASSPLSCKLQLVAAEDENNEEYHEDDDEEEKEEDAYNDYDPLNENKLNPCRRHPTWWGAGEGIVDYEMCQELTGWSPRDSWWHVDTKPTKEWLSEGKEDKIAECLDAALVSVPDTFWWAA
jgi:hypothetical protein